MWDCWALSRGWLIVWGWKICSFRQKPKKKRSMQWCRVVQAVGLGEKSYLKVSFIYTVYTIQYTVYLKWEAQFWSGVVEADLEAHWLGEAVHFGAAQQDLGQIWPSHRVQQPALSLKITFWKTLLCSRVVRFSQRKAFPL